MKASAIAFATFLLSNVGQTHGTSIKMDYLPAGVARTDPIITQTCLSDHVHTFYGPQEIRPETDHAKLINTPDNINTGNVVENKSLYWHPTVYSYNRDTQTYTRDEMAQSSAYYIWENDEEFAPRAFPNGFKMIAGLDPTNPQNFPNAEAECVDPTPCTRPEGCYTENTFFPATACAELEVSMSFPTCWDGTSLDSEDHQSHVRYTLDGDLSGPCPDSHPVRLPQIQLFFRIMPYSGGWHTFSDMSSVFHADYISGWDEDKLQEVLDNCVTDSVASNPDSFCEEFLTFRDGPKCKDESVCDFGDPALLQKLHAFQPPPIDVSSIISTEETDTIVGELPRGSCTGTLIPLGNVPNSSPNSAPTAAPNSSPSKNPTLPPRTRAPSVIGPTTKEPTRSPSKNPTLPPRTRAPVTAPTTKEPTRSPSNNPSPAPSPSPTRALSQSPTSVPTVTPSQIPTESQVPTAEASSPSSLSLGTTMAIVVAIFISSLLVAWW